MVGAASSDEYFDAILRICSRVRCCASSAALRRAASSVAFNCAACSSRARFCSGVSTTFTWAFTTGLLVDLRFTTTAALDVSCFAVSCFAAARIASKACLALDSPLLAASGTAFGFASRACCSAALASASACALAKASALICSGSGLTNVCFLRTSTLIVLALPEVLATLAVLVVLRFNVICPALPAS